MFFSKKKKKNNSKLKFSLISVFLLILVFNIKVILASIYTVNLGSLWVNYLDFKASILEYFNDNSIERRNVKLNLNENNFVRLNKELNKRNKKFILTREPFVGDAEQYNSKVSIDSLKSKSKIKLFGMMPDHYRDPNGHSFRLTYNGGYSFGKKKENFSKVRSNDFNTDIIVNLLYKKISNSIEIKYEPVDVILNKKEYGIYLKYDFFDNYLVENNNFRDSYILERFSDSLNFNHVPESINNDQFIKFSNFFNDRQNFFSHIDIEKLIDAIAISLILNDKTPHTLLSTNLHWFYNSVTNKFEPTLREGFTYSEGDLYNYQESSLSEILKKIEFDGILTELNGENILKYEIKIGDRLNKLDRILNSVLKSDEYLIFKNKLVGYRNEFDKRERIWRKNLDYLNHLNKKTRPYNPGSNDFLSTVLDDPKIIENNINVSNNEELIIRNFDKIIFKNNAKIFVNGGNLIIEGNQNSKIEVEDNSSSSIYIEKSESVIFKNTTFDGFTSLDINLWQLPSALTFYESNVKIENVTFKNNRSGDDMVNFFRCNKVDLINVDFENIISDAIDSDFSNVKVKNCTFNNIGNDGVDGSGSEIVIESSTFINIADKAVSAGEKSNFLVSNSLIEKCELGLVVKDGSQLKSDSNIILDTEVDLVMFMKKKYFDIPNFSSINTEINYGLIEEGMHISGDFDQNKIKTDIEIEDKLYGNVYGKATVK